MCVYADPYYNSVRLELDSMAQDFEVESWSLAVDQHFLKKHSKKVIKRQDVIYGERGRERMWARLCAHGVCACVSYTLKYPAYTPHMPHLSQWLVQHGLRVCYLKSYLISAGSDLMLAEPACM